MNSIHYIKFQIFSLFIILQIFYQIGSTTSYDYPYSITLPNDNIFLIQKTGIDIYDIFLNKINQIFEFSGEEEISEEKFGKIAIKYNNEYILSIINDKMFIFNNEGKLLYNSEEKINDNQTIYSYSLTFINVTNNTCDYIVGYFGEDSYLNLFLYRYDNESNNITLLYKFKNNEYCYKCKAMYCEHPCYTFNNEHKILSCEYIYYNYLGSYYKKMIVCFFNRYYNYVGIAAYEFNILYNNKISQNYDFQYHSIGTVFVDNIKKINNNRTLAIVWWNFKGNNLTRYYIYNMKDDNSKDSKPMNNTCINEEYGTRINVFPSKDQISFSCVIKDENVQILFYNKTNLISTKYDPYLLNASCENINGLSRLYFNDDKNYYIYSCFKNCSDKNYENDTYCLNIKRNEEIKRRNTIIILIVIISVIIITLLIVFILIYRKYWKDNKFERNWKQGKNNEKLMNDIMTDLIPNN